MPCGPTIWPGLRRCHARHLAAQTRHFWKMGWTLTDDNAPHLLDRRRRTGVTWSPPTSPVTVHDDGRLAGSRASPAPTCPACAQVLAATGGRWFKTSMKATDLGDDEQLCALAFIKRRFARCLPMCKSSYPASWDAFAFIGPCPAPCPPSLSSRLRLWLAQVLAPHMAALQTWNAAAIASPATAKYVTWRTTSRLRSTSRCVRRPLKSATSEGMHRRWAELDRQLYFPTALENPRLFADRWPPRQVLQQLRHLPLPAAAGLARRSQTDGRRPVGPARGRQVSKGAAAVRRRRAASCASYDKRLVYRRWRDAGPAAAR